MPDTNEDPFYLLDRLSDLREARSREARSQPSTNSKPLPSTPAEPAPRDPLFDAELCLIGGNVRDAVHLLIEAQKVKRNSPRELEPWLPRVDLDDEVIILEGDRYGVPRYFALWVQEILDAHVEHRKASSEDLSGAAPKPVKVSAYMRKNLKKIPPLQKIVVSEKGHGGGWSFKRPDEEPAEVRK